MNVRSSTRATSPGSDSARKLFGRRSGLTRWNVPPSTRSCVSRSHSSSEPSHHSTESGCKMPDQWSTQSFSFWLVVVAAMILRSASPGCVSGGGGTLPVGLLLRVPGRAHVDLRPQPQTRRPTLAVEVEDDTLALAEHPEHRAFERVGCEIDLDQIGVAHHDPVLGPGIV